MIREGVSGYCVSRGLTNSRPGPRLHPEALKRLDAMALVTLAKHGKDSAMYGQLQSARAKALDALGRDDEARTARAEAATKPAK